MADPALVIFPQEFVPNIEGSAYHPRWVSANRAEAAKWASFRDAVIAGKQVAPPSMTTKYGKALIAAGKEHMAISRLLAQIIPPWPPAPGSPGGSDPFALPSPPNPQGALPLAPGATGVTPTIQNISSTLNVSTAITDVTFNVTASVGIAIELLPGGSLTRCVLNCNGLVTTAAIHTDTGGTCSHVRINNTGAVPSYGFVNTNFGGNCYVTRCYNGVRLAGTGLSMPAACTVTAYDCDHWGVVFEHLANSTFSGLFFCDRTGFTINSPEGTGFQTFTDVQNVDVAYVISNRHSGYGAGLAQTQDGSISSNFRIRALSCDATGALAGGDPGFAVAGQWNGLTIDQAYVKGHSMNTVGEYDFLTQIRRLSNVSIGSLDAVDCAYNGFRGEHCDGLTVNNLRMTNCGTADPTLISAAALCIGMQPHVYGDGNQDTYCTGVSIPNFIQIAGANVPKYAVQATASSTGSINGTATSWSTAKVNNLAGAGFTVNV